MSEETNKDQEPQPTQWDCHIEKFNRELSKLTVGDKFNLVCAGEALEGLDKTLKVKWDAEKKDNEYTLFILEAGYVDDSRVDLVVTGYKPNKYNNYVAKIGNDKVDFVTSPLSYTIASVRDPKAQPEMKGPAGPFKLELPWWYWASWAGLALIVLWFIAAKYIKYRQRREVLDELNEFKTVLTPFQNYNKEVRKLSRLANMKETARKEDFNEEIFLKSLDESVRLYLVREFLVPAHKWGTRETLSEIKKRQPRLYQEYGQQIKRLLFELDKAQKGQVSYLDCEQLADMGMTLWGKIQNFKNKRRIS